MEYTIEEAANRYGVTIQAVRYWISAGKISGHYRDRKLCVDADELSEYYHASRHRKTETKRGTCPDCGSVTILTKKGNCERCRQREWMKNNAKKLRKLSRNNYREQMVALRELLKDKKPDDAITLRTARRLYKINENTLRNLIVDGLLGVYSKDRITYITKSDVENYLRTKTESCSICGNDKVYGDGLCRRCYNKMRKNADKVNEENILSNSEPSNYIEQIRNGKVQNLTPFDDFLFSDFDKKKFEQNAEEYLFSQMRIFLSVVENYTYSDVFQSLMLTLCEKVKNPAMIPISNIMKRTKREVAEDEVFRVLDDLKKTRFIIYSRSADYITVKALNIYPEIGLAKRIFQNI